MQLDSLQIALDESNQKVAALPEFSLPAAGTKQKQCSNLLPDETAEESRSRCLVGEMS